MQNFKDFLSNKPETSSPCERESTSVDEALSFQGRRQRAITAKRLKQKLQRAKDVALKRPADLNRLHNRGRRSARDFLTKLFYGGKSKKDMSITQKARAEKKLDSKKGAIKTISKRLLPSKRRQDVERRTK